MPSQKEVQLLRTCPGRERVLRDRDNLMLCGGASNPEIARAKPEPAYKEIRLEHNPFAKNDFLPGYSGYMPHTDVLVPVFVRESLITVQSGVWPQDIYPELDILQPGC